MIIKLTRGSDFAFIDNEGEVQGQVKVSGNNEKIVNSLDEILNVKVGIRFKGEAEGVPDEIKIRQGDKPVEIYKASDLYLKKYFVKDMELQGFGVEIVKE